MFKITESVCVESHPVSVRDFAYSIEEDWQAQERLGDLEERIMNKGFDIVVNDSHLIVAKGSVDTGDNVTVIYSIIEY